MVQIGIAHLAEPIPADEIVAIQRLMESGNSYHPYPYHLQEGMMVTVIRGPLQNLHGRLVRSTAACQLILAVNLIQQAAAVEVAPEDVALAWLAARAS